MKYKNMVKAVEITLYISLGFLIGVVSYILYAEIIVK